MDYQSLLAQQTSNLGDRVFKEWGYNSDGIGNTMQDFYRARPDLFQGINFAPRRLAEETETGSGANYWDFGKAGNDALSHYKVQRRGEDGMKDGRRDVVVDSRTGEIVYAGANPYTHDPAKTNLKDAATFAALALGGYYGVNALGGMGGAAGGGAAGGAAGGGMVNGAFLGEGVASGIPAWDAAAGMGGTGLLGGIGKAAGTALDFAKSNPRLVGGLLGGLTGAAGGGSDGGGYKYTGPMPTISREGWNPQANASLMQTQSVVNGLPQVQGNQYSGLLRYLGG